MVGIDKTIFYNFIKDYQIPLAQFKLIDNSSDENIKIAAKATIPLDTLKENARNLWQDKKKVEAINDRLKAGKNHQYFTTFIHWPEDNDEIQFSIILDSNIYLNMMR